MTQEHETASHARDKYAHPLQTFARRLSLTLLTVNTHKGFSSFNRRFMLRDLREALLQAAPDIVFLQEVLGAHRGYEQSLPDWPSSSQYEYLADTVWPDYAYGRNAVYPDGHHGNAVLSRYPIVSAVNHDVSTDGPEPRGLLHCVLQPPQLPMPLHAVCVHLGLREAQRRMQLQRLCDLATHRIPSDEPLLVAGDFNDWRQRASSALARCGLDEIHSRHLGRPARSYPAFWPLLRLDRIYVRGVRSARPGPPATRLWARLSDHIPLVADVVV